MTALRLNRTEIPSFPNDDPRLVDSTGALELGRSQKLLIVGGGIIGLEMATVYHATVLI